MMNLRVQVTASLCLVLLVIQPALNQPTKSFKELSYDETEHERAHANIRIVKREVINPTCDCHSKITKLPAVTIYQGGARTFPQPIDIDIDDLPKSLRLADEDSDDVGEQELLLRKLYEKYGKNVLSLGSLPDKPVINNQLARLQQIRESDDDDEKLNGKEILLRRLSEKYGDDLPSLGPHPSHPVINKQLALLQQTRKSDIDADEVPANLRRLYQNDEKLNGEVLLLRKLREKYEDNLPICGSKQPPKPVINKRLIRLQQGRELDFDADEVPAHLRRLYQNDEKLNGEVLLLRKLCEKYEDNLPICGSKQPPKPVINKRLIRLQQGRELDFDADELIASLKEDKW